MKKVYHRWDLLCNGFLLAMAQTRFNRFKMKNANIPSFFDAGYWHETDIDS
jgi:hypothetical protein